LANAASDGAKTVFGSPVVSASTSSAASTAALRTERSSPRSAAALATTGDVVATAAAARGAATRADGGDEPRRVETGETRARSAEDVAIIAWMRRECVTE
jgi:hypothetical protein